jgi:pimeloyl-ACP methyl ester carboxylesterase
LELHSLRIDDYVGDLAWGLEQCPEPPVLVAHSMGAFVALRLLQRRNLALKGLVLVSPASAATHRDAAQRMLLDHPLLCGKLQMINSVAQPLWPWIMTLAEMRKLMFSPTTARKTAESLWPSLQHESALAMLEMLQATEADAPRTNCPALTLGGRHDTIVPADVAARVSQWLPSELQILPDLGHVMMLDDNWRQAADAIACWLDRHVNGGHDTGVTASRDRYE